MAPTRTVEKTHKAEHIRFCFLDQDAPVQTYNGDDSHGKVEQFVEDVEYALSLRGGDAVSRRRFVWQHLGDTVRQEVKCHPPDAANTAEKLLSLVTSAFRDKTKIIYLHQQFYKTRQRENESIRSFSYRLRALFDRINEYPEQNKTFMSEYTMADHFSNNVLNSDLRHYLQGMLFRDSKARFIDIRDAALRWCASFNIDTQSTQQATTTSTDRDPTSLQEEFSQLSLQVSELKQQLQRYQCSMPDHSRPSSTSKQPGSVVSCSVNAKPKRRARRRCYVCHSRQHLKRECPIQRRKKQMGSSNEVAQTLRDSKGSSMDKIVSTSIRVEQNPVNSSYLSPATNSNTAVNPDQPIAPPKQTNQPIPPPPPQQHTENRPLPFTKEDRNTPEPKFKVGDIVVLREAIGRHYLDWDYSRLYEVVRCRKFDCYDLRCCDGPELRSEERARCMKRIS